MPITHNWKHTETHTIVLGLELNWKKPHIDYKKKDKDTVELMASNSINVERSGDNMEAYRL